MKKFIRDVLAVGGTIGLVMGGLTYATLAYAGTLVQYDMANMSANSLVRPLNASESINMGDVRGLTYSQGQALDYCGLYPSSACSVLEFVNDVAPNILAVECGGNQFQIYQEDDVSAAQILQPTDPSKPMVTMSGLLLQNSTLDM